MNADVAIVHKFDQKIDTDTQMSLFDTFFKEYDLDNIKEELLVYIKELISQGIVEKTGSDEEVRPYFVTIQAMVEILLCSSEYHSVTGVIHSKMPPTCLCTKGDDLFQIVDSTIEEDELRMKTVLMRTKTIRKFLESGAKLHLFYPKGGLEKRSENQRSIYQEELAANARILDHPLDIDGLPDDLCGAFYIFEDKHKIKYAFAIQMTQANDPKEEGEFGIWFGLYAPGSPVSDRIKLVKDTLNLRGI